jgi:hypothetical protein
VTEMQADSCMARQGPQPAHGPRQAGRFRSLIRGSGPQVLRSLRRCFSGAVTVSRPEPDLNPHGPDLRKLVSSDSSEVLSYDVSTGHDMAMMYPRGDLNTETGAISPDRGNHAIRGTRGGRTNPAIPRRVRYPVRYLACTWLCGRSGHLLPHRWQRAPRVPGSRAARADRAAFRDELGTHARGAVLRESICAGAGGPRVQGLVVLARKGSGISAHA